MHVNFQIFLRFWFKSLGKRSNSNEYLIVMYDRRQRQKKVPAGKSAGRQKCCEAMVSGGIRVGGKNTVRQKSREANVSGGN